MYSKNGLPIDDDDIIEIAYAKTIIENERENPDAKKTYTIMRGPYDGIIPEEAAKERLADPTKKKKCSTLQILNL